MSGISGISQAGQSLQSAWNRISQKTADLSDQLAGGDVGDTSLVQTIVELKSLKLQADATGMIFKTLNDMASELLTTPRK